MEIKNEKLCSMSTPSHGCCLGEEYEEHKKYVSDRQKTLLQV